MTLSNALLGYEPILDSDRNIIATRISVAPMDSGQPLSVAAVYEELAPMWPVDAAPLLIDIVGASPDEHAASMRPVKNCWLGLSVEVANDPVAIERLQALKKAGFKVVLSGELISRLADDVAERLFMTVVPAGATAEKPFACSAVDSIAKSNAAFGAGAQAIMGWPVSDIVAKSETSTNNPSFEVIGRLLALVNANATPEELEPVFKQDPSLSFRLLRYLNSAACGLRIEIQSIQHAVMMIGLKRLKKWLALLLATAAHDPELKPLMFASLRRGLLLESMVGDVLGNDSKDEAFILGVFSLLDKLFNESFDTLFERLQIPEAVHDALVSQSGQYMPYLRLAEALEGAAGDQIEAFLTDAFVDRRDCNTILIRALGDASSTENM